MRLLNSFILFILYCTNVYAIGDPSTWSYDGAGSFNNAGLNLVVKIDGVTATSGKVAIANANGDVRGVGTYGMIDPFNSGFAITVYQPSATAEGPYTLHYSSDDSTVIDLSPGYTWSDTTTSQESTGSTSAESSSTNALDVYDVKTTGAPGTILSKEQCEYYASLLGVTMSEDHSFGQLGCTVNADNTAVNYKEDDGNGGNDCGYNSWINPVVPHNCVECKDGETCLATQAATTTAAPLPYTIDHTSYSEGGFDASSTYVINDETQCKSLHDNYATEICSEMRTVYNWGEGQSVSYDIYSASDRPAGCAVTISGVQCRFYFNDGSNGHGDTFGAHKGVPLLSVDGGGGFSAAAPDVDCAGTWSAFGACSAGSQSRTFTVTTAQSGNGQACPASPETQSCTGGLNAYCTDDSHCDSNNCVGNDCVPASVDCAGTWSDWGECTDNQKSRSFTVTTAQSGNGAACPSSPETVDCHPDSSHVCDGSPQVGGCTGGPCGWVDDSCSVDTDCDTRLECSYGACSVPAGTTGQAKGAPCSEDSHCDPTYCSSDTKVCFGGISWGYGGADGNGWDMFCPATTAAPGGSSTTQAPISGNAIVLSSEANVDLLTLKRCDSTNSSIDVIDDTNQNYGMVHSIGLTYQRDNLEAGRDPITYCQDQQFVTTIARDASAATSVTTLVAPSLQRSVVVHGVNWVKCESQLLECAGSNDCYKLQVDLSAREKNVDDTVWTDASLSDAFQHEGGANTDQMSVVHSLSPLSTGSELSLVGKCGIIPNCSISDPGIDNHWYDHTSTEQDVVLRGTFQFVDVDSIAKISTAFSECPLGATTTYNGELKLGLKLGCEDRNGNDVAITTIDSDVTDANGVVQNCRSALTSSLVKITTDVYVNTKNPVGKAAAEGWEMKDIDFKFNRYEASLTGEPIKTKLISSDLIMQMRYDSDTNDWTCTRVSSRITGLPLFDQAVLDCDISDLTTTTYSSSKTGLTHTEAGTIMFDLQPLQMANMDAYEVEVIAMIQNLDLEKRRLRTSYLMRSGGLVNENGAFPTISGNVTAGDSGEQDKERNEHLEQMIVILIVIAVLLGFIAAGLFMCCRRHGTDMTTASLATIQERQQLISRPITRSMSQRGPRFKNLRY